MKQLITILGFILLTGSLYGQMWNGQDTLYGNEWIQYNQAYFKFKLAEDGLYRLSYEQLTQAGIPLDELQADQLQLYRLGEQVPIYISSENLAAGTFIEFYGKKNRSEFDRHLFADPDLNMLNPEYSLYTDSSTYFLTWTDETSGSLRLQSRDNVLDGVPAPENWHWATSKQVFTDQHYKRYEKLGSVVLYYSHYDGDGFSRQYNEETNIALETPDRYTAGPRAELDINLIGNANSAGHNLQIDLNNGTIRRDTFFGPQLKQYSFQLDQNKLSDNNQVLIRGLNDTDRYSVAFGRLRYPRAFNFSNESELEIELTAKSGVRYLELTGLGNTPLLVIEPATQLRMMTTVENGIHRLALPAAEGIRMLYISLPTVAHTVDAFQEIQFTDYSADDTDFVIISNKKLFNDGSGNNWVQAYADYRSSAAGGNFQVRILEVDQLYDQFAYGQEYHPLSVRNAFNFLYKYRFPKLRFIFIIGKGREFSETREEASLQAAVEAGTMMVPAFGYPASDNLLLTTNETVVSPVPVGRLAVVEGSEVEIYLRKVKAVENVKELPQTVSDRGWTKHVLHLGGGSNAIEQNQIRTGLENLASQIEESSYGASVQAFYKSSTDVIQNSLSQQIFDYINQGTSIITFFGHSSPGTFDFNIDNPDNYENEGKYPFILSLGCYSGNMFSANRSIGERFTFYEDKAAVNFAASRGLGYISALYNFADELYDQLGNHLYGHSIGEAMQATYRKLEPNFWIGMATLVEQFALHGDPAIRLYPVDGPDYVIDASSASFNPEVISTQLDSFDLSFDIVNLGRNQIDSFDLNIRRVYPDGTEENLLTDTVIIDRYRKSFTYRMPVNGSQGTGQNTFYVSIDTENAVAELPLPLAESNNELVRSNGQPGLALFIVDNTARTVYPPEFALIGNSNITLKASTTNALAPERAYWFELDTTALFDSPLKTRQVLQQKGGVLRWTPAINWQDSTVYYWRVSPAPGSENPEPVWSNSSFSYIGGSPAGWRQGHYWQFGENEQNDLRFTDSTQQIEFGAKLLDMRIRNKIWDEVNSPSFHYNNDNPATSIRPWLYLKQGVSVVVFEPNNGVGWRNQGRQYGSVDKRNNSCFSYDTSTEEGRAALMNLLTEVVPDDHIVFLFTVQSDEEADYLPGQWAQDSGNLGQDLFTILENEGATLVRELETTGSVPYVVIYTKGGGMKAEGIGMDKYDDINVSTFLPQYFTSGILVSERIGPAGQWGQLQWRADELELPNDTIQIKLIGYRQDGSADTLIQDAGNVESLEMIDAAEYPYLGLAYASTDEQNRSIPFLNNWTIYYEGIPELAINPAAVNYFFQADTLQQGIPLKMTAAVENLSDYPTDSLDIQFTVLDVANEEQTSQQIKAGIDGNDQTTFEFELDTDDMSGRYRLITEVNPDRRQMEYHYFNNIINQPFEVVSDRKNPILDVTFDGKVILNGDLVGANPSIVVRLKDENPYLLLSDTSLIDLHLITPDGQSRAIALNSEEVSYTTATNADKNELTIDFHPTFTVDGTYALRVNGKDVSGNFSGALDYQVEFEVRTRNSISNVLNYPNPFSTSTQFVYTLTGTPPAFFKIQILSVSGRIVREITQDEIGPLQVGTNKTDFAWDGTDEFGDRLANGVYLYRIVAKDAAGKDFEAYDDYVEDTGLSGFFKQGFGKMVLLR